jgi:hypothetical protein
VWADRRLDAGARCGARDDAQHGALCQSVAGLAAGKHRIVVADIAALGQRDRRSGSSALG